MTIMFSFIFIFLPVLFLLHVSPHRQSGCALKRNEVADWLCFAWFNSLPSLPLPPISVCEAADTSIQRSFCSLCYCCSFFEPAALGENDRRSFEMEEQENAKKFLLLPPSLSTFIQSSPRSPSSPHDLDISGFGAQGVLVVLCFVAFSVLKLFLCVWYIAHHDRVASVFSRVNFVYGFCLFPPPLRLSTPGRMSRTACNWLLLHGAALEWCPTTMSGVHIFLRISSAPTHLLHLPSACWLRLRFIYQVTNFTTLGSECRSAMEWLVYQDGVKSETDLFLFLSASETIEVELGFPRSPRNFRHVIVQGGLRHVCSYRILT